MTSIRKFLVVALVWCLLGATPVYAQQQWGISASFTPNWKFNADEVGRLFVRLRDFRVAGPQFSLGLLHGRTLGGDTGVEISYKKLTSVPGITNITGVRCSGSAGCANNTENFIFSNASLLGLEGHKYWAFATIKRRLHIGMTLAGGFMAFSGQANFVRTDYHTEFDRTLNKPVLAKEVTEEQMSMANAVKVLSGLSVFPTIRLELGAAAIIGNGTKIRMGYGRGFPGNDQLNVTVSHFFGSGAVRSVASR